MKVSTSFCIESKRKIIFFFAFAGVVPAPKNLRFSDVTLTSFQVHWEHGAPDVALYRIGWSKSGESNYQYVRKADERKSERTDIVSVV